MLLNEFKIHAKFFSLVEILKYREKTIKIIQAAFKKTNKKLLSSPINIELSGCTCNVVLVAFGIIYCANVGDSRAILVSNNPTSSKIVQLSTDHKPTIQAEAQRIAQSGGEVDTIRGVIIKIRCQWKSIRAYEGVGQR
jgi:serine/threonine protein phosphatase PrpC